MDFPPPLHPQTVATKDSSLGDDLRLPLDDHLCRQGALLHSRAEPPPRTHWPPCLQAAPCAGLFRPCHPSASLRLLALSVPCPFPTAIGLPERAGTWTGAAQNSPPRPGLRSPAASWNPRRGARKRRSPLPFSRNGAAKGKKRTAWAARGASGRGAPRG
jgi:hypothetical protein